jgi:hypothetical protein
MSKKLSFRRTKKLHRLLAMALEDLKAVEKLSEYKVTMSVFIGSWDGKCHVCLAGACLVRRVGCQKTSGMTYTDRQKMYAINLLRRGDVGGAIYVMGWTIEQTRHALNRHTPDYGKPGWWEAMEALVVDLRKANL